MNRGGVVRTGIRLVIGVVAGTICCVIGGATILGGFGIIEGAVSGIGVMEGLFFGVYLGGGVGVFTGPIVGIVMGIVLGASTRRASLDENAEKHRAIAPLFTWILVGAIVGTLVGAIVWSDASLHRGFQFAKWSKIELRNWVIGTIGGSVGGIATGAVLGFVRHYSRLGL